jgi:chromosome segregation ATPase
MKELIQILVVTALAVVFMPTLALADNADQGTNKLQSMLDACGAGIQANEAPQIKRALSACKKARKGVDSWTSQMLSSDKSFNDTHKHLAKLQRIRGRVLRTEKRLEKRLSGVDEAADQQTKKPEEETASTDAAKKDAKANTETDASDKAQSTKKTSKPTNEPLQASGLSTRVGQLEYDVDSLRKQVRKSQVSIASNRKRIGQLSKDTEQLNKRLSAVKKRDVVTEDELSKRIQSIRKRLKNADSDTDYAQLKADMQALSEDLTAYKKQTEAYKRQMDEKFSSIESRLMKFEPPSSQDNGMSDADLNARIDARIEKKLPDLAQLRTDLETLRSQHQNRLDAMDKTVKTMRKELNQITVTIYNHHLRPGGPVKDDQE